MSSEATKWVRDRYGGPANTVAVLFVIATYADREGRGCRASIATIAAGANKGIRQVKKDIAILRKEGVIAPGDQSLVAHLHREQRPVVYDIPAVADPVSHSSPPRGTRGHQTGEPQGQNPVNHRPPKTSPTGRDRAGRAQGSAQRPGAPDATHAFVDAGHGSCAQCLLPAGNARHSHQEYR